MFVCWLCVSTVRILILDMPFLSQSCNMSFGIVERSLAAYLDSKKLLFPRFFFLSNDELIEILSEAKEPLHIQPFAKKIIEAVK